MTLSLVPSQALAAYWQTGLNTQVCKQLAPRLHASHEDTFQRACCSGGRVGGSRASKSRQEVSPDWFWADRQSCAVFPRYSFFGATACVRGCSSGEAQQPYFEICLISFKYRTPYQLQCTETADRKSQCNSTRRFYNLLSRIGRSMQEKKTPFSNNSPSNAENQSFPFVQEPYPFIKKEALNIHSPCSRFLPRTQAPETVHNCNPQRMPCHIQMLAMCQNQTPPSRHCARFPVDK